jgi:hypothetical protein
MIRLLAPFAGVASAFCDTRVAYVPRGGTSGDLTIGKAIALAKGCCRFPRKSGDRDAKSFAPLALDKQYGLDVPEG